MWSFVFIFTNAVLYAHALQYNLTMVEMPTSSTTPGNRIIGGTSVSIERYPYTVQVLYNSGLSCGGSLITQRHVLSAAHCFKDSRTGANLSPTLFTIRVGTTNLNYGGSVHRVSVIVTHEAYNSPLRDNDVAVLLLSSAVTLGNAVGVARIPLQDAVVPDNSSVTLVGWGRTSVIHEAISPVLMQVQVLTVNNSVCAARYQALQALTLDYYPVTQSMLCAGLLDIGGRDACQGDSGGPVIYNEVVVGITSWGYGCADPRFPGVNARVASYTNWINSTVTRYNASSPLDRTSAILLLTMLISSMILSN